VNVSTKLRREVTYAVCMSQSRLGIRPVAMNYSMHNAQLFTISEFGRPLFTKHPAFWPEIEINDELHVSY